MIFIAIGNAKASILVVVMRKFILLIPLIYIMLHIFTADKARAIYMADFFAVSFITVLLYFQFKKDCGKWTGSRQFENGEKIKLLDGQKSDRTGKKL